MQNYLYNLATDRYRGFIAGVVKILLFILSLIYGFMVKILILLCHLKPSCFSCKVISVGNLTWGGTGKTSLVAYIAKYLKQKGHKVAILSRGYKRRLRDDRQPVTDHRAMGDEPTMLVNNLRDIPVMVGADRVRAARQAMRDYGVDTIILDDGLQQWRIKKDLEIATIDSTNPFGNRQLIPRGILREGLCALKRPDIFVLTKTNINPNIQDIKDLLSLLNPSAGIFESIHQPVGFYNLAKPHELINLDTLKAKTVTLLSAIGDPVSFEKLIRSMDIDIGLSFKFRDHHNYTQKDLDRIAKSCQDKNINTIITTEKDAMRLTQQNLWSGGLHFLFLRIELKIIKNEEDFYNRLQRLYSP